MKKFFIVCSIFIFTLSFVCGCSKREAMLIGIAEDPKDTVSNIYQSLSNGRKLALELDNESDSSLKMIEMNTQNDPENTANIFRTFFQENSSGIMLGTPSVECAQIAKYIAQSYDRTFLCDAYDSNIIDNVDTTILFNQNPLYQGRLLIRYILDKMKKKRACVVYDTTNRLYSLMHKGIVSEGNSIGAIIMEVPIEGGTNLDPNRIFAKVATSNPECIIVLTDSSLTSSFLVSAKNDFHIFVPFFFPVVPKNGIEESLQEQVFFFTPFFEEKPAFVSSEFFKKYEEKFNSKPSYFAALGFDEIVFLKKISSVIKHSNWNKIYQNLKGMSVQGTDFLTGLQGFSKEGFALKPIDIVQYDNQELIFKETYWHTLTKNDM